jgi:hypothetical protein
MLDQIINNNGLKVIRDTVIVATNKYTRQIVSTIFQPSIFSRILPTYVEEIEWLSPSGGTKVEII